MVQATSIQYLFIILKFLIYFSDEGITETFECVEPLVGRYVSIVRSGVEDVLSLCEVEVFSTNGLSASVSCSEAQGSDSDRVAVFEDNCFHFLSQEVSGFNEAVERCENEDAALLGITVTKKKATTEIFGRKILKFFINKNSTSLVHNSEAL